jgi:phosphoserine aminotransferase
MLCVEDYIDALEWSQTVGGLEGLIARADANTKAIADWVAKTDWVDFLASRPETRSNTSVCLKVVDPAITALPDEKQAALVKADRPLKTLLEARSRANLPVLVVDDENRLQGLVTEREMIHAILEKRGVDAPAVNGGSA